ncbi:MAG: SHOCT domain-containing protein [Chloroflexi bacterium]|nr:MAG: SHOCT domain-containing protein [Chloroflexota bacterium]
MATKSAAQQQQEAEQNAQIADLQQQQDMQQQAAQPVYQQPAPPPPVYQQPAPPPPAPSTGMTDDSIAQLKQLGELHESGVLTDAEFVAAKQKILGN